MTPDILLTNLNPSQHAAVTSIADTLAILAGPGSGKTHTLTSRTAWLLAQGLEPWNIIVATFTVKAAREMKERIGKLIGNGLESKLILGTFHSICRRYLARYGHLIGIRKDFGIADSGDSVAIIKRIIKRHGMLIDPKIARSRISARKARGQREENNSNTKKNATKSNDTQEFEICYEEYEVALERSNLLDYDDLLLRCVNLLQSHPDCVQNVEAVLIDEFQDTNQVQLDLMKLFAVKRNRITIVGDPDQSIYGFRAAEVKNYKRMLASFPDTVTIALEENYRSSAAILLTASTVIEQDTSRVAKSLLPTHTVGSRPVLRKLSSAVKEADYIVSEILRCLGMTGNLLDLNDFAILLRSASLSRTIESSIGKAGIAYRMVGGLRFYDRLEVKTILDYLRVINQPDNNDALARIINVPSRRIGEATVKALLEEADSSKVTLWSLVLGVVQGTRVIRAKLGKQALDGLTGFVNIMMTAKKKLSNPERPATIVELINFILRKIDYEKWLENHHGDAATKSRWTNVQEVVMQAADFLAIASGEDDSLPEIDGLQQADDSDKLTKFLANVSLASEVKKGDEEGFLTPQVTISTIHAAKGLEWPVVFVPAAYQGSIPHSRAEDMSEERRLLYVAMTRAKVLLYISYPLKSSNGEATTLSTFLSEPSLKPLLNEQGPSIPSSVVQTMAQILRRSSPSLKSIYESQAQLRSAEDDQFPLDGTFTKDGQEVMIHSNRMQSMAMDLQALKRQRNLYGGLIHNTEGQSVMSHRTLIATTVNGSSSFTSAATTVSGGFMTAASCLKSLEEQALEKAVEDSLDKNESGRPANKMKSAIRAAEGQRTLNGFLGKPGLQAHTIKSGPVVVVGKRPDNTTAFSQSTAFGASSNRVRIAQFNDKPQGISPELSAHRLGHIPLGSRTRAVQQSQEHLRNDYIFLSSSPIRSTTPPCLQSVPERELDIEPLSHGVIAKSSMLSLIRPAISAHETTVSLLQNAANGSKKTLGVKRRINEGWANPNAKRFVPPTMKRSVGK